MVISFQLNPNSILLFTHWNLHYLGRFHLNCTRNAECSSASLSDGYAIDFLLNFVGCYSHSNHHDTHQEYPDSRISLFLLKNYKPLQNLGLVLGTLFFFGTFVHKNLSPLICQMFSCSSCVFYPQSAPFTKYQPPYYSTAYIYTGQSSEIYFLAKNCF